MAGKRGGIGENAVVADVAVVADMGVGHDEAMAADAGRAAAAGRPARNGDAFADDRFFAKLGAGGFVLIFQVLRSDADAAKGKILSRAPDFRCPSRTTCETSSQSSPSTTFGPIVE